MHIYVQNNDKLNNGIITAKASTVTTITYHSPRASMSVQHQEKQWKLSGIFHAHSQGSLNAFILRHSSIVRKFPTHLSEVCLQGFAPLVNSARDFPRTFSGGLMRWVRVKMTVTLV